MELEADEVVELVEVEILEGLALDEGFEDIEELDDSIIVAEEDLADAVGQPPMADVVTVETASHPLI